MSETPKSPSAPRPGLKRKLVAMNAAPALASRPGMAVLRRTRPKPPVEMVQETIPAEARLEPFETIRVFDLARLRQQLHRSMLSATRRNQNDYVAQKQPLIEILDRGHVVLNGHWPDVVVMRRPKNGNLQTNFAVIGHAIYLGEHLSRHWLKGKLDESFYRALHDALKIYVERQVSHFGAPVQKTH
jgi:hypothetical protein